MKKTLFLLPVIFGIFTLVACDKEDKKDDNPTAQNVDIDGNVFHEVKIGTQIWMVENLKVTHYRNGDPILQPSLDDWGNQSGVGACCSYMNNDSIANIYGRLYNFYAVTDPRNIAPKGWHVPSKEEWLVLINFLGGENEAGAKLKEAGTDHWAGYNLDADTTTGFNALPGGYLSHLLDGSFQFVELDYSASFYSSTLDQLVLPGVVYEYGRSFDIVYNRSGVFQGFGLKEAYSVRCIKD